MIAKGRNMQKSKPYTVDLNRVDGDGKVNCPKCGVEISPDDTSENVYTILEPILKGESLEKIILQCNKCGSRISLTGFQQANSKKNAQN